MSGYYLLDNPSRIPQHRTVRRNGAAPSGVVVLHTAENATDFQGVDEGAEAVARFIVTRSDPGSYHVLVDSDSTIRLAPWSAECWHDTRTNNHAVGISAAVRSADWSRLGARGERAVVRMALAAREYAAWLHTTRGVTIPARRITRAQALARVPGFIGHGEIDPGRRTDPGRDFDWGLFLAVYAAPTLAAAHGVIGGGVPGVPDLTAPDPLTPEDDLDDNQAHQLANVYAAMFAGGPDTPGGKSVLALLDDLRQRPTAALTPEQDHMLRNVYAAIFTGGESTPEGKSLLTLAAEGRTPATVVRDLDDAALAALAAQVADLPRLVTDEQDRRARERLA